MDLKEVVAEFLGRTRMGVVGKGMFVRTDELRELGLALEEERDKDRKNKAEEFDN